MPTTYVPANDPYKGFGVGLDAFGGNGAVVVPSDTVDFAAYPKALVVTAAGNVAVLPLKAADDGAHLIAFTAVQAGFIIPFRVRRVMATGTTASLATIAD
jgi:hypothetical protein